MSLKSIILSKKHLLLVSHKYPKVDADEMNATTWGRQALQCRHNERDGGLTHQSRDCLLNRLFRRRSKKKSNLHVTGLFARNSPVTG